MSRIQITDLPTKQNLTPEQLKELFGAGQIKPGMEALESRMLLTGSIDFDAGAGVLTIDGDDFQDVAHIRTFKDARGDIQLSVDLYSANVAGVKIDPSNPQPGKGVDYLHKELDMSKVRSIVFRDFDDAGDFYLNKSSISVIDHRDVTEFATPDDTTEQALEANDSKEEQESDNADTAEPTEQYMEESPAEDAGEPAPQDDFKESEYSYTHFASDNSPIDESDQGDRSGEGDEPTLEEGQSNVPTDGTTPINEDDNLAVSPNDLEDVLATEFDRTGGAGKDPGSDVAESLDGYIPGNNPTEADSAVADFEGVMDGKLPESGADTLLGSEVFDSGQRLPDMTSDAPQDPLREAGDISKVTDTTPDSEVDPEPHPDISPEPLTFEVDPSVLQQDPYYGTSDFFYSPADPGPDGDGAFQGQMTQLHQQEIRDAIQQHDARDDIVDPVENAAGNDSGASADDSILDVSNPGSPDGTGEPGDSPSNPPNQPIDYGPDHVYGETGGLQQEMPDVGIGRQDDSVQSPAQGAENMADDSDMANNITSNADNLQSNFNV